MLSKMEQRERDDQGALIERLWRKLREPLKRYFYRRVSSWEDAEDLTHELFVRLARKVDLHSIENPEAFVFQVATNLICDRSRRLHTAGAFMAELTVDSAPKVEILSPERILDAKQSLQIALKVLSGLDSKARAIFILHRVEGLKYSEIADIYGITKSAVEKQIGKCLIRVGREVLQHR